MSDMFGTTRFHFWLCLIRLIGVIVPRRLRADWKQEWESELRHRELLLAEWDRIDWRSKFRPVQTQHELPHRRYEYRSLVACLHTALAKLIQSLRFDKSNVSVN